MNKETLTYLAKRASVMLPMIEAYPDPDNDLVTFPPSPYYRFLKLLADRMQADLSVELGVCGGGGSLHLAMASKKAIGVDIAWDHEANITWIIRNYHNFLFLQGDSIALSDEVGSYGQIDILFIDTTHTYEQTMREYNAYAPFLSDRAVICLDDLYREGMDQVWAEMGENKARFDFLHPSASPTDGGFGVIWR